MNWPDKRVERRLAMVAWCLCIPVALVLVGLLYPFHCVLEWCEDVVERDNS
jgi:hypothetical protein